MTDVRVLPLEPRVDGLEEPVAAAMRRALLVGLDRLLLDEDCRDVEVAVRVRLARAPGPGQTEADITARVRREDGDGRHTLAWRQRVRFDRLAWVSGREAALYDGGADAALQTTTAD